jgi:KDO2-lipid IV(A) lauroyltransferase
MSRTPTFKHRVEYAGLYTVFLLSRILPRRAFVRVGSLVGRICFDLLRIRRDVTMENLRFVFGHQQSERELVALGRRSYEQLGGSLLEFSSLYSLTRDELLREVRIDNLEALDAIRASGRGAMLVTGHFGNWELFGAAFVARGYPTTFLVKEQSNPLASRMQNLLRARGGIEIIKQGPQVARHVLRALQRGHLVGILPDQDARRHGVFVDFLGRPASTYKGPAYFAYHARVPIVAGYIRRNPDGTHHAAIIDPLHPDTSRPEQEEIHRLTQEYVRTMEEWVRRYPEHYFWVHRRWKTRPPQESAGPAPSDLRGAGGGS